MCVICKRRHTEENIQNSDSDRFHNPCIAKASSHIVKFFYQLVVKIVVCIISYNIAIVRSAVNTIISYIIVIVRNAITAIIFTRRWKSVLIVYTAKFLNITN